MESGLPRRLSPPRNDGGKRVIVSESEAIQGVTKRPSWRVIVKQSRIFVVEGQFDGGTGLPRLLSPPRNDGGKRVIVSESEAIQGVTK
jgi:hypothetical protein